MNPNPSSSLGLDRGNAVLAGRREPGAASRPAAARPSRAERAESLQKAGRGMILAGFVITIAGVVGYCAVCFAGGMNADMGDLLLKNAVPFARATLAILGGGTLVWLIGSFTYLHGAMDADEEAGEEERSIDP